MPNPTQPDSWLDDLLRGFINTWYNQQDKVQEYEEEASVAWVRLKQQINQHEAQAVELARIDELVGVLRDAGVIFKNGKMSHRYKFIGLMFIFNRLAALRAGKEKNG